MTKFETIAADIADKIAGGTYAAGDRLPTMSELCDAFGVSRITVKRALDELERAGLIARKQGKGTFVRSSFDPRSEDCSVSARVISFGCVTPPEEARAALGLTFGEFCFHFVRTCILCGTHRCVEYGWLPIRLLPGLAPEHLTGEIRERLRREFGLRICRVCEAVFAKTPSKEEAGLLGCEADAALLNVRRTYLTDDGVAAAHVLAVFAPSFVYTSVS